MADKRKSTSIRNTMIYILLVIATGLALSATGHFDDPIAAITASMASENSQGSKENIPGNSTSPDTHTAGERENRADGGDPTQTHEEALSINWSRIGDVLFDIWFIGMVTAVIVVLQQLFGFANQLLYQRLHPK